MAKQPKDDTPSHFPRWYDALQRNAFIPAIILVEGIIYGVMFTWGLAPQGNWESWDISNAAHRRCHVRGRLPVRRHGAPV
jgi:hypothetical protein